MYPTTVDQSNTLDNTVNSSSVDPRAFAEFMAGHPELRNYNEDNFDKFVAGHPELNSLSNGAPSEQSMFQVPGGEQHQRTQAEIDAEFSRIVGIEAHTDRAYELASMHPDVAAAEIARRNATIDLNEEDSLGGWPENWNERDARDSEPTYAERVSGEQIALQTILEMDPVAMTRRIGDISRAVVTGVRPYGLAHPDIVNNDEIIR